MKTTVNFDTFTNDLRESFSIEAIELLFDYFEQYEEDCDCEFEFDPIAIRCEFAESTINEILHDYGYMMSDEQMQDTDGVQSFLEHNSIVCGSYVDSDGDTVFVYAQF